jgi:hypothetical protein
LKTIDGFHGRPFGQIKIPLVHRIIARDLNFGSGGVAGRNADDCQQCQQHHRGDYQEVTPLIIQWFYQLLHVFFPFYPHRSIKVPGCGI